MNSSAKKDFNIAIIGAGPAGIGAGHELLQQGFTDFTIFDALDAPGGTWRLHSYPGLACDVWAHSYSFSYAPNPDWSANFVGYASEGAHEDAFLMAVNLVRPDVAASLVSMGETFGLALRRVLSKTTLQLATGAVTVH